MEFNQGLISTPGPTPPSLLGSSLGVAYLSQLHFVRKSIGTEKMRVSAGPRGETLVETVGILYHKWS